MEVDEHHDKSESFAVLVCVSRAKWSVRTGLASKLPQGVLAATALPVGKRNKL